MRQGLWSNYNARLLHRQPCLIMRGRSKHLFATREITGSFQHALKHALRQDPDIIMIGEMRDSTSFTAAMNAADTGHLVLSTLHTTNASQSVSRILDFFKAEEREQIRRPTRPNRSHPATHFTD